MSFDPTLDFNAVLRLNTGSYEFRSVPGLDAMIYTLGFANILPVYVGQTAPTSNQNTTVWLLPQNPSWQGPGQIMLWDSTVPGFVTATPALFVELLNNIGALVTEGVGAPASMVGIPGSLYLQTDNGKVWYKNAAGVWTVFQTAIANIGTYITGHGGPGDALNVNLAALEAQLKTDLANTIAVAVQSPITGNGLTATPLGLNIGATISAIISNGGLNDNVQVAVDGTSIGGNGVGTALHTIPGGVSVVADGTSITGNGTTASPLIAHAPAFAGLTGVSAPLTGIGTSASPLGVNFGGLITDIISNGGLNDNVQVAVDGTTITGNGTTASPLVSHAGSSPAGSIQASGAWGLNAQGTTSPSAPGFPGGVPSSATGVVGYQHGCSITFTPGGGSGGTDLCTITLTATPGFNYVLLNNLAGDWDIPPASSGWTIEGTVYNTNSVDISFGSTSATSWATYNFIFVV